jgi:two-component system sensor kinase FixL
MGTMQYPVLDAAFDGIILTDGDGNIRLVNAAVRRMFGYSAEELEGRELGVLLAPRDAATYSRAFAGARSMQAADALGISRQMTGRRRDGTLFPLEMALTELSADSGRFFLAILRDVTDRIPAEVALAETEEWLRSLLSTAPDGIIVIDEHAIIQSFSDAAARIFGYDQQEIIGKSLNILMPEPYRSQHDRYIARYLETGERHIIGISRIVVGQRADGTIFPLELNVGEMFPGGKRMFTGFLRDLTEVQRKEMRLQDLQAALLHASRFSTVGRMSSTLAHEINQPLAAIANYTQAALQILQHIDGKEVARAREILEKAIAQTARAGNIIRHLREFLTRREMTRRSEDLNQVVQEASALALIGAGEHDVRVHFDLAPERPKVWINKVQIQQVVMNLVSNAIEAVQAWPKREITITTEVDKAQQVARVCVIDTGPGLAPEVGARLFQPFVSTKPQGMGLGLSICREIMEAHGGQIQIETLPTSGTRACATIPIADEDDDAGE